MLQYICWINNHLRLSYKRSSSLAILSFFILIIGESCQKYLDVEPKGVTVPSSLSDLQAMLDASSTFRYSNTEIETVTDDYYVTTEAWQRYFSNEAARHSSQNYIWVGTQSDLSWDFVYRYPIYYANTVLDALPGIENTDVDKWNNIRGAALLIRAFAFWQIAQLYCSPYSTDTENNPGIPLKLSSSISEKYSRRTVRETYRQIVDDLIASTNLLAVDQLMPSRPGKAAAYGLLARVYLSMREYSKAAAAANSCLQLQSALLDYKTLLPEGTRPIPTYPNNPELIWVTEAGNSSSLLGRTNMKIDTVLYKSYSEDDARKQLFFGSNADGSHYWKGSYSSELDRYIFPGVATDEIFLIRAECSAREGLKDSAMNDLNRLLIKRWKNSATFIPYTAINAEDAKNKVLIERRKELCFRGVRWSDLRRLNLEGANITIKRDIAGTIYQLPPNDIRWTLLIPQNIINLSGIEQNPR